MRNIHGGYKFFSKTYKPTFSLSFDTKKYTTFIELAFAFAYFEMLKAKVCCQNVKA